MSKNQTNLTELKIVHVYGTLGRLSVGCDGKSTRNYNQECSVRSLRAAVGSLKVIHEHRETGFDGETIRESIGNAKRICYLGFSFDEMNVARLALDAAMPDIGQQSVGVYRHGKEVFGTAYAMKAREIAAAAFLVKTDPKILRPQRCGDYLREFGVLLS